MSEEKIRPTGIFYSEHEEGSGDGEKFSKANVQALMQYMEKHQQQLEEQKKMLAEQQQRIEAQQEMIERHHELTARVSGMMEILTPGVQALMQKQVEAQEEKKCCNEGESHSEKMRKMDRYDDLWIIDLIAVLVVLPMILMRLLKLCARVSWAHRRGACGVLLLGMTSAAQWIVIICSAVGQLMKEPDKA